MTLSRSEQVLLYINEHPDARFDDVLVTALQAEKPEINEILFSLIHEDLITEENGRLKITSRGSEHLQALKNSST